MSTFRVVTDIEAPVEACFDLSRSIDLHLGSFRHEHQFETLGAGTRMTDVITFRTPLAVLTERPVGLYLRRLMRIRNAAIRLKAQSARG